MTSLYLYDNDLRHLDPVIGKLHKLKMLSIAYNPIQTVASDIVLLRRLRTVRLAHLPELRIFPEAVANSWQLRSLNISSCPITRVPETIGQLSMLKHLDLTNTQLETLPPELFYLQDLKDLNLAHNSKLREIPYLIANLQRLARFKVTYTPLLTAIPCALHLCWRLESFRAYGNPQLCKAVSDGGLGLHVPFFEFTRDSMLPPEQALAPLMKKWKKIFVARARMQWLVSYLFLGTECTRPVAEAVWISYPRVIYN
jgi:hypothetical protein